ncbi:branched-chain amino acid ABC transporter permease [Desulfosporosinus sp. BICA1-9]|uniref:branched-chain amino acid ABC transporter permease n=1 Tax=Desulfosporosinus sp. BICA1-9 TaxID=1531958 RepID=UPI00054B1804|nr:branched-chain amino acid ABC transporter permease [Desulfosporosinus sp. BICA1-9]KJS47608.1 MAG: ABC transporter permease [Peptococcaceae bacterium BRH_c23]KJS89662.1 MAG: ABC transporter permease [Desulfosporosinus sp. BICA1-9]HBW37128.1 branched-chain amino acid ABC transporter permease [Desulfosporosinus sp.]
MESIIQQIFQQIINGLSLGSIYALIALGYTMVYGIIKLINFAHGEIMMVGAYAGWFATSVLHLPFLPALLFAMIVAAILGVVIERIAYKPLRNATRIAALITAIGVSLFLQYGGMLVVSAQVRTYPPVFPETMYSVYGVIFKYGDIVMLLTSIILMGLLHFTVQYTKMGKAMRAVSFDKDAALLMGINTNNIISFTFAIGSALAAAAGVLMGVYFNTIDPLMGLVPGLKAFVAAVLGGIGIIPGAMVGGLMLGLIESIVSGLGASTWRDAVAFLILILVLIIKPSGLFGKNVREKV